MKLTVSPLNYCYLSRIEQQNLSKLFIFSQNFMFLLHATTNHQQKIVITCSGQVTPVHRFGYSTSLFKAKTLPQRSYL